MNTLIWPALIAFGLTLLLTPLLRDVMRRYGMLDRPDRGRKLHKYPVPHVGGIAIAIAYAAATVLVRWKFTDGHLTRSMEQVLAGGSVIFAVGLIDDFFELKPLQKLVGQILGVAIACGSGLLVPGLDVWIAFPLTMLWLLGCTNAMNLVDGMDGLAAGVGLIACLALAVSAILHGQTSLTAAILPFAACLAAFLFFNFSPATVFLGDSGSLAVGYMLGCFSIQLCRTATEPADWMAPVMILTVPLLEVALTVARRTAAKRGIFHADRGHMHHRLLSLSIGPGRAALVLYSAGGLAALLAIAAQLAGESWIVVFIAAFYLCAAALGIRFLDYAEFEFGGSRQTAAWRRRTRGLPAKL